MSKDEIVEELRLAIDCLNELRDKTVQHDDCVEALNRVLDDLATRDL